MAGGSCERLLFGLLFGAVVFVVATLTTLIASTALSDTFASIFIHTVVGIVAAALLLAGWAPSLAVILLLISYQTLQTFNTPGDQLGDDNIAGYVIGYSTAVLTFVAWRVVWLGWPLELEQRYTNQR